MPKTFYTERDVEDLVARGVTSLDVNDDVVLTDLARDRAAEIGLSLLREHDAPPSAPERPYIATQVAPPPAASAPVSSSDDIQARVRKAVVAQLGNSVDAQLLDTIIRRVLQSVGK
ncbi:MAG: hypothetical protein DWQ07_11590 [Chloroflexi bacterium]|nr:MAG: hypothetical protein DWQ07_11590 [Chloroflexota bacterium]MBL1197152.1 hypothetical protein [Chloroflexota bacterium]NOH14447.1 hypothetical protein [Chloroflexota bacterium]